MRTLAAVAVLVLMGCGGGDGEASDGGPDDAGTYAPDQTRVDPSNPCDAHGGSPAACGPKPQRPDAG